MYRIYCACSNTDGGFAETYLCNSMGREWQFESYDAAEIKASALRKHAAAIKPHASFFFSVEKIGNPHA